MPPAALPGLKFTPAAKPAPAPPADRPPPHTARPPAGKPGTELAAILAALGFDYDRGSGCRCEDWTAYMDGWGIEGSKARRDEIVAHLRGQAAAKGWLAKAAAAVRGAAAGIVVNPLDPCPGLLDLAISRAEAKATVSVAAPAAPPPPAPRDFTRHLLYYVCPVAAGGGAAWRWNVGRLLRRIDLFDGRRVLAIATAPGDVRPIHSDRPTATLDPPAAVRAAVAGHGFEVVEVANDPRYGEVVAFDALFAERAATWTGPRDVTFYAHAKGVSYAADDPRPVRQWADVLYRANLDFWPLVDAQFRAGRRFVGSMRQADARGRFIYSGNFFWMRNAAVFRPGWRPARRGYAGVELWPRRVAHARAAGVVWLDYPGGFQAYDPAWMGERAAEFDRWAAAHAADRTPAPAAPPADSPRPTLTVVVPTCGRPTLARALASARGQMAAGDELLVEHSPAPWGNAARNRMVERAKGDAILFMDDDDEFAPGAFAAARAALAAEPDRPHIFRMRYPDGRLLWQDRELREGNVSTQMFVVPNRPGLVGRFGDRYAGDFDFIAETCGRTGPPAWHEDVIALYRPRPA